MTTAAFDYSTVADAHNICYAHRTNIYINVYCVYTIYPSKSKESKVTFYGIIYWQPILLSHAHNAEIIFHSLENSNGKKVSARWIFTRRISHSFIWTVIVPILLYTECVLYKK